MLPLFSVLLLFAVGSPADFSSLQFEVGTWNCTGKTVNGDAFGAAKIVEMSADGNHMLIRAADKKAGGTIDLSYDATRGVWVEKASGPNDSHSEGTSPGWVEDKLVFLGQTIYPSLAPIDYRITTIKLSDTATTEIEELKKRAGGWLEVARAHCDKTP